MANRLPNPGASALSLCAIGMLACSLAHGEAEVQEVVVLGHYENGVGTTDAASAGSITAKLIETRPELRPGEVLEFVPGVIVTQHSGDGKANQYFLRGFNLDHGTDFATWIDEMPMNMRSHAHGQGYTDLNILIPELVARIDYRKGPYYADEGDFSSAGATHIRLADSLAAGTAALTLGENNYRRALLADSVQLARGDLLFALEYGRNDGPWENAERFDKRNGVLRFSSGDDEQGFHVTAMGYSASWTSTDQIPLRAVGSNRVGRFGTLDPTDGGDTARYSVSADMHRPFLNGAFSSSAYAIESRLTLVSNFTFFLDDPVNGDQFEQTERRRLYGFGARETWTNERLGRKTITEFGLEARIDNLDPVGLFHTIARRRLETIGRSVVREGSFAAYWEDSVQWNEAVRTAIGARFDRYHFNVDGNLPENSGTGDDHIVSPKASLIVRPWTHTEVFLNYGQGFHSNDARGTTETITPRERLPADPVTPLVKTRGAELGARTEIVDGLQTSIALWRLDIDSELVFSGDAGDTEASRPSRRYGVELNNHYTAASWLLFDFDLALSRAGYTDADPAGSAVPASIEQVASFGMTIANLGRWFGDLQLRYFGPRPLIEDSSVRSKSTTLAYLDVGYLISSNSKVRLDVFNLFNRAASDIDYFYASRLPGEPSAGVEDIHFHPVEPRTFRLRLTYNF